MILKDGNYVDVMDVEALVDGYHRITVATRKPGNLILLSIQEEGLKEQEVIASLSPHEAQNLQYMLLSAINTALASQGDRA